MLSLLQKWMEVRRRMQSIRRDTDGLRINPEALRSPGAIQTENAYNTLISGGGRGTHDSEQPSKPDANRRLLGQLSVGGFDHDYDYDYDYDYDGAMRLPADTEFATRHRAWSRTT